MKRLFLPLIFCALLGSSAAFASHPAQARLTDAVEAVVDALFNEEAEGLSVAEKQARVRAVADDQLEFRFVIQRAFGRNWRALNEAQQEEAVNLITETLIKTYVESFAGQSPPGITYGRLVEINANRVEIPSSVTANGQTVSLLYRLARLQSGWELIDVVAENVSMVANYRQQLDDHFRRGNAESLLVRLRDMAARGEVEL